MLAIKVCWRLRRRPAPDRSSLGAKSGQHFRAERHQEVGKRPVVDGIDILEPEAPPSSASKPRSCRARVRELQRGVAREESEEPRHTHLAQPCRGRDGEQRHRVRMPSAVAPASRCRGSGRSRQGAFGRSSREPGNLLPLRMSRAVTRTSGLQMTSRTWLAASSAPFLWRAFDGDEGSQGHQHRPARFRRLRGCRPARAGRAAAVTARRRRPRATSPHSCRSVRRSRHRARCSTGSRSPAARSGCRPR